MREDPYDYDHLLYYFNTISQVICQVLLSHQADVYDVLIVLVFLPRNSMKIISGLLNKRIISEVQLS